MIPEIEAKLDELGIVSPILRYQLARDILIFGQCAIETINVGNGVKRRRRGQIEKMAFDREKGKYVKSED